MLSVEQSGSITEQFDAVKTPLTYRHLLSQLNFTLKLKGTTDSYRIRSVHINGLASTAVVDLGSEAIEPLGNGRTGNSIYRSRHPVVFRSPTEP